jgi:hypothetical protein
MLWLADMNAVIAPWNVWFMASWIGWGLSLAVGILSRFIASQELAT